MLNTENEMNRVILFFTIKHKGNWEKAYSAIKTKENITLTEMNGIREKYLDNYISIIDNDYPDNYKQIYMPPLSLFTSGNKQLLQNQKQIYSIWSADRYQRLEQCELNKGRVYAILFSKEMIPAINRLTNKGYKLIVINHNYHEDHEIYKLEFNGNVLHLTEIPLETTQPDLDEHQNCERLLLGISSASWALDIDNEFMKNVYPIFEFEKRILYTLEQNANNLQKFDYIKSNDLNLLK